MYFVNPHYRPLNLSPEEIKERVDEIQLILSISKYDRKNEDKRKVFEYFIDNKELIEIERSKSLKARILCCAEIELISVYEYEKIIGKGLAENFEKEIDTLGGFAFEKKEYIILEEFTETERLAVIKTETKEKIMRQDESEIKQKMENLREYSLIKKFEYHEILYLAHFFEKISSLSYKQFVFTENDKADEVYFIKEGEFQVFKDIYLQKDKSLTKLNKIKSKSSLEKSYELGDESTLKKKETKIKKEEISRLTGSYGQTFGEIELFLSEQVRLYSLKCNSSSSSLYRISFRHFQEIFKDNLPLFDKMKKECLVKFENDQEKVKQNQKLKNTISFSEDITSFAQRETEFESKAYSPNNFQTKKEISLSNSHIEESFTLSGNSSNVYANESNAVKNLQRSRKLYSENAKMNKNHRYNSGFSSELRHIEAKKTKHIKNHNEESTSHFVPIVNKTTEIKNAEDFKLPLILNKDKKNNKVRGLMDLRTIISEKQQLLSSISNLQNPEFSFYKLDEKHAKKLNFKRAQLETVSEEESSLAHSENFIKSLVKRSLKKSGYLIENNKNNEKNNVSYETISRLRTQSVVNTSSFSVLENPNNEEFETHEKKNFKKEKQGRSFLISNGFDKFFYKI